MTLKGGAALVARSALCRDAATEGAATGAGEQSGGDEFLRIPALSHESRFIKVMKKNAS